MIDLATSGDNKLKFQAGAKFTLLGKEFEAIVNNANEILVMPYKSEVKSSGISLSSLINELEKLYNDLTGTKFNDTITTQVESIVDISKLEIDLEMLFLHIKKDANDKTKSIFEYAFKISLNNAAPKVSSVLAFNSMFCCIWNTNNQNIIEQMGLKPIENMLA